MNELKTLREENERLTHNLQLATDMIKYLTTARNEAADGWYKAYVKLVQQMEVMAGIAPAKEGKE